MVANHYWIDQINPYIFHFTGSFGLRYYGMAYLLSFLIGYFQLRHLRRLGRSPLSEEQESNVVSALILGVIIGGRLGYMAFYGWPEFLHHPLALFEVWNGGMSSHGGFIGVALACIWITSRYRVNFFRVSDILCILVPPGLFLVRIANYLNGELWGKISRVPWAVIFPKSMPEGTPLGLIPPRHPSQLYEALLEGGLLFLYAQWRFRRTQALEHPGRLTGEFLVLYALVRILGELFREPDAALILGMSRGIFYSLFLIPVGAAMVWNARRSANR